MNQNRSRGARRRAWRRRALVGWLTAAGCLVVGSASAETSAEQREAAREHFRLGNEAFARHDRERALAEYQKAYVLGRSFDIACNLGRVEHELRMWAQAAGHLDECLQNFSASTRPELRQAEKKFAALFDDVRGRVALFRIDVVPERGVLVTVDDRSVLGPFPAKAFVLPGEHTVAAHLEGGEPTTRVHSLSAGGELVVQFDLRAPVAPVAAEATEPAAPSSSGSSSSPSEALPSYVSSNDPPTKDTLARLKWPVVVGGGVLAAAGVGLGTFFQVRRGQFADDAEEKRGQIGGGGAACSGSTAADARCADLQGTLDDGERARALALGGFVAGGVLAVGTVAAWLFWPETRSAQTALGLTPVVGDLREDGGVWGGVLHGSF